jgi:predicted nucleic acid-binding protein
MRDLPEDVFSHALRLVQKWTAKLGTRSLDIMHVAVAVALSSDTFLTFDERQGKLARAARLAVT